MSDSNVNNKRIAKNTMMLYVRMLLMMGVTLYTSRVVLRALGVEDFGIYNVVGGVVAIFSTMTTTLSVAIGRFITFELGRGDQQRLNRLFSTSVVMQIAMGGVILLLIGSVGLWFLTHKMVIPPDRLLAAKYVLLFSAISVFISMISVPYNATIIAHERMSAFAYIGILEAIGKLLVAYMLVISPIDRLIVYSIMMMVVGVVVRIAYGLYCCLHFEECKKVDFAFDKDILKELFGFAGWNSIGVFSYVLREHGVNILLNIFFGAVVNAAKGISTQVLSAVTQFTQNFMVALNPQITKSYANNDKERMMILVFQGARLSFYMILFLTLPILLNTNYILMLWLGIVPEYTVLFVQLSLIFAIITSISYPLTASLQASGDIRNYQIADGAIDMLNLPISYLFLNWGFQPASVLWVSIFLFVVSLFVKVYMASRVVGMSAKKFVKNVIINIICVSVLALIVPLGVSFRVSKTFDVESLGSFMFVSFVSILSCAVSIYFVGCNREERKFIVSKIILIKKIFYLNR